MVYDSKEKIVGIYCVMRVIIHNVAWIVYSEPFLLYSVKNIYENEFFYTYYKVMYVYNIYISFPWH
jgi:hypothetical protein